MKNEIINGFDFGALPIKVDLVGKVESADWPHYLWNVTFTYQGGVWVTPYKCGLGHVEKKPGALPMPSPPYRKNTLAYESWERENTRPKKPTNARIINSLLLDMTAANQSFDNWCYEFEMSNDSMKAFKTYQACCEIAVHMNKTFDSDTLEKMKEALVDY